MNTQQQSTAFTAYQKFVIFLLALTQFSVVLDFILGPKRFLSLLSVTHTYSSHLTTMKFSDDFMFCLFCVISCYYMNLSEPSLSFQI